jgi:hypothetical protein
LNLLLGAALLGWVGGMIWARAAHRPYQVPNLRWVWLVLLAFIPQFFAFVLPATRSVIPNAWIPVALVGSQALLLLFSILNIRQAGFWLLGIGLLLNLAVILLNGGMMPISPDTLQHLYPNAPAGAWQLGERFGVGKDVVLPAAETTLWFLSDCLVLPDWISYKVAFSLGDVLIALGAFWMLLLSGGSLSLVKEPKI